MIDLVASNVPLPPQVLDALRCADIAPTAINVSARQTGRNPWWIVDSDDGTFFVKLLRGTPEDVQRRLEATNEFERIQSQNTMKLVTPRLHSSSKDGVLIYENVETVRALDIGTRLRARDVDPQELAPLGAFLASLHTNGDAPSHAKSFTVMAGAVTGLSLTAFIESTAGQLSILRRLHRDPDLRDGVHRLATLSEQAPTVSGHGDLRVDQLLATPDGWMVCDWEEYCSLDPAWELGSIAGDFLSTALGGSQSDFAGQEMRPWEELEVSNSFEVRIQYTLPLLATLLRTYEERSLAARSDSSFRFRMAGFCGWHLIERMLAAGSVGVSVSGLARGIGGIGRAILINPGGFSDMLSEEES